MQMQFWSLSGIIEIYLLIILDYLNVFGSSEGNPVSQNWSTSVMDWDGLKGESIYYDMYLYVMDGHWIFFLLCHGLYQHQNATLIPI
jgi:hypothetical protein